jgi:hypothetical protein
MGGLHQFGLGARHDEQLGQLEAGLAAFDATMRLLRETARRVFADAGGAAPRLEGGTTMISSQVEGRAVPPARRTVSAVSRAVRCAVGAVLLVVGVAPGGPTGFASAAEDAPSRALLDQMAQGKMDTDLGRFDAAIAGFGAVVDSKETPPSLRTEALVRLGVARRESGDPAGAFTELERASKDPGLDAEAKALLVRALGGVLPGDERWEAIWRQVAFAPDRSDPKRPTLQILWPGVPRAKETREGDRISLDFVHGDLQDILRLFADISGLNVVVFPGTKGSASLKVHEEPWPDVLQRILAANGLAYRWEDNVLLIGEPEALGRPRRFTGRRIDVDWGPDADPSRPGRGRDLREALAEIAAAGRARVALDPAVQGGVVFKLDQVRWDQVFDTVALVNGLDWTREGDTLKVFPRTRAR